MVFPVRLLDGQSGGGSGHRPDIQQGRRSAVEGAFKALLQQHPDAKVGAVSAEDPNGLLPVPDSIPLGDDAVKLTGASVDLVAKQDRALLARLWWQAQMRGVASAVVRLVSDNPGRATLTLFDLRDQYGVLLIVIVAGAADGRHDDPGAEEQSPGTSRFARMTKDGTARVVSVDEGLERMLGYPAADLIGRRMTELIHPDDRGDAIEQWIRMCESTGPSRPIRLRHLAADGRWVWVEVTNYNRLEDPAHGDVLADMVDVSEEVAAHQAVLARQQLLEQVTATVPIGLLHADVDGVLLYANARLTELTGLRSRMRLEDWPGVSSPHHRAVLSAALATALTGSATDALVEVVEAAGEIRNFSLSIRPLLDHLGLVRGVTGSVEDVTVSVAERRELEVRAATDPLTGCLNRAATLSVIQDSLGQLNDQTRPRAAEHGDGVAVIFLDVDNLKEVNDELGHSAGDSLLVEVASRLQAAIRGRDTVGRFGGDEFVLAAVHVASAERAMTLAQWVASRVVRPFLFDDRSVPVRASLGVAWTSRSGVDAAWLVGQADAAMYRSKREGRCEPVLAD